MLRIHNTEGAALRDFDLTRTGPVRVKENRQGQ